MASVMASVLDNVPARVRQCVLKSMMRAIKRRKTSFGVARPSQITGN